MLFRSIQKLTARPQGFYVRWKKVPAQISGYEIQYARKASFAKAEIVRVDASRRAAKILNLRGEKKEVEINGKNYSWDRRG